MIKIWDSEYNDIVLPKKDIGRVVRLDNGVTVGTGRGELTIKTLQLEGGKKLDAASFLRGHKIAISDKLD
jgi:methionyl-tRNA formyltransferase